MNNGSQFNVGMETENARVVNVVKGGIEDPTIQIQTKENTMQTISNASDPIMAFQEAKEAEDITITGNNDVSNLKVTAALSSMDILRFFYGVLSTSTTSMSGSDLTSTSATKSGNEPTKTAYTKDGKNYVTKERMEENIKAHVAERGDYKEVQVPIGTHVTGL